MRHFHSIVPALSLCLAVAATAPHASAQDTGAQARVTQAQKLGEEGAALYQTRDFRRALERFQQAYAIESDPNLLYNIARCYDQLGERESAIEKYEAFVRDPSGDPQGKERAHAALKSLQTPTPDTGTSTTSRSNAGAGATAPSDGDKAEARQSSKLPTYVALGVGVAGLATGVVAGALALGGKSDLDSRCSQDQCPPSARGDLDTLKTESTISTIGLVVGGVGLATAALFWVLSWPTSKSEPVGTTKVRAGSGGVSFTF